MIVQWDFPHLAGKELFYCWKRTKILALEEAWNGSGMPLHGFSAKPQRPTAKLAACWPEVCRGPGLLVSVSYTHLTLPTTPYV